MADEEPKSKFAGAFDMPSDHSDQSVRPYTRKYQNNTACFRSGLRNTTVATARP